MVHGAADSVVVGASGVIFGYLGLLLMRGIVERSWWNIAVGPAGRPAVRLAARRLLPGDERISWQGHLFGFLGGLVAAILFRRRRRACGGPTARVAR